jgi:hypothetical protein
LARKIVLRIRRSALEKRAQEVCTFHSFSYISTEKSRIAEDDEEEEEEDSDDEGFGSIRESLRGSHNPLAGYLDSITGEEVFNPYISKYGHVLSYTTWTKSLMTGKCPFTNQPLGISDLKRITIENFSQYRSTMKNKMDKGK